MGGLGPVFVWIPKGSPKMKGIVSQLLGIPVSKKSQNHQTPQKHRAPKSHELTAGLLF